MIGIATPAYFGQLPKLHVYVDETGDRGFSEASRAKSPFFAMTALIVPREDEWTVKVATGGLRAVIHGAQPQQHLKPLHWVEHFKAKRADRREQAALVLANMPSARLIHVVAHKDSLNADAGMRADKGVFYNYTCRLLLERVAYAAQQWPGGPREATVRLDSVKHMDHSETRDYLAYAKSSDRYGVPWRHIKWPPLWENSSRDGIQLADIHAGFLNCALTGQSADPQCAEHLLRVGSQLYRSRSGTLLGYGMKVIGDPHFVTSRVWWSDLVHKR